MAKITKTYILDEIRRTANGNGGVPLGRQRFYTETGIKEADSSGRYWARWSDALNEAGLPPNRLQVRLDDALVLEKLVLLIRELGRLPVEAELKMHRRKDRTFPSHNTFSRFGSRSALAGAVASWCEQRAGYDDVIAICAPHRKPETGEEAVASPSRDTVVEFGDVYLLKSGRNYKIGRSNAAGRRGYELAIQLPEKAAVVHTIKTDDPSGIESYWHRRFADRRKNGEWFELTAEDVAAFKRRRLM
jgi:hypothetical protein